MLSVAIEEGTTAVWYGRFIHLPGTHARALSRYTLLEELQKELEYHLRWLEKHGRHVGVKSHRITVKEEVKNVPELGESGGAVALFEFDKQPVDEQKIMDFFSLMDFNRDDLLSLTKDIPRETMEYVPAGKTRTITDIVAHICNAEEFYMSRLGKEAESLYEGHAGMSTDELDNLPLFDRLYAVRKACKKTLFDLIPGKGASIFTRSKYTRYPQEKWTAYKVMRRFLEHEREHYYNILEYVERPKRG
jgi:hypothetical protein